MAFWDFYLSRFGTILLAGYRRASMNITIVLLFLENYLTFCGVVLID